MRNTKKIIGVALIIVLAFTGGVFASGTVQNVTAQIVSSVKVVVDGREQTFKDVNGKVVYPMIYEGTTYLPVRAIGNLMGKDVDWDGTTQTVYLGSKTENSDTQSTENGFIFSTKYTTKVTESWTYTTSEVTNNSGKDCSMVQIESTYYGKDGTILGKGTAYVYDIKNGQTKTFETMEYGDFSNAESVKFQTNYVQNQ